jgi:prolyl-tRNA synthetase
MRIEVGPKDLEKGVVTISRRDILTKEEVKFSEIKKHLAKEMAEYDKNLFAKALANREQRTYQVDTFAEYLKILATKPGFVLVPFCGRVECEMQIKEQTATNSRCIPFNYQTEQKPCFHCQQLTTLKAYFGRAY